MKTNFRARTGLSTLDLLLLADPATNRADNVPVANRATTYRNTVDDL